MSLYIHNHHHAYCHALPIKESKKLINYGYLLLTFFGFFFLILPCLSCPEYQKQAPLRFKSSILAITSSLNHSSDDSGWQSWNSSSSCCGWDRVKCNDHSPNPNPTSKVVIISLYLEDLFANLSPQPRVESTILAPLFHIRSLEELTILAIWFF